MAALLYTIVESAMLNGLDPRAYLRAATVAALTGETVPLPHELAATTAA